MTKKPINSISVRDMDTFEHSGEMNLYQRIATKSAFYPGQGTPLGLAYVALKLNGEAGEFAEHVGKAMRDDEFMYSGAYDSMSGDQEPAAFFGELTPERKELLVKEIGDVLWYLSAACNELGITLSDAAGENLYKLYKRTQNDTLRGSGDER